MNEFQVDLTHPNPVHTLRNDDSIAILAIVTIICNATTITML